MFKPFPKGVHPSFKISESEARKYKMYKAITGIPVSQWSSTFELAKHALDNNPKDDGKTYDKYKATFNIINKEYIKQPSLVRFTKLLVEYMNLESTKKEYEDHVDDIMLTREETRCRKKIKTVQTQKLNEELSVELGCSSTSIQEDCDSTYITGEPEEEADFVHKKIYDDAVKLHQRYKATDNLTPEERKRMCAGLSGVIDISDNSYQGHRSLFSINQWKNINECYAQFKQSFLQTKLDSDLALVFSVWNIIYTTLTKDHNIFHARKTFNRMCSDDDVNEYAFKQLQIIDYILDTFDNKLYILNPAKPAKLTERDYESTIWVPLFAKLFSIKKIPLVRIKSGESVPEESSKKKAQQYKSEKNIIGFKVDIRLIHDHEDLEIDLASIEISLPFPDDAKVCHDESKLLRESAISTETIHHLLRHDYVYTWTIRVSGLMAIFSKVLYDDERHIYVNIYQFTFIFPTCISELEDLKDSLEVLFKFKEDVERIANKVQKELKHTQRSIYRSEDNSPERKLAPTPSVYFTPPRNEAHRSVLPM